MNAGDTYAVICLYIVSRTCNEMFLSILKKKKKEVILMVLKPDQAIFRLRLLDNALGLS